MKAAAAALQEGDLIVTTGKIDRARITLDPGFTGKVIENSGSHFSIALDQSVPGLEEWDNEIIWIFPEDDFPSDRIRKIDARERGRIWSEIDEREQRIEEKRREQQRADEWNDLRKQMLEVADSAVAAGFTAEQFSVAARDAFHESEWRIG